MSAVLEQLEALCSRVLNVSKDTVTTRSLLSALAAVASSYYFMKWVGMCRFSKKCNIPGPMPKPVLGNFVGVMTKGLHNFDQEVFQKYGNIAVCFEGGEANILCRDVDMIKHVMIKDFSYFVNRRTFDILSVEPFTDFLTVLKDDEWKSARSILTTTFTGAKLKQMFDTMEPCVDTYVEYLGKLAKKGEKIDAKDSTQKLTFDVICSCCFGVQTDSVNNPNDPFITELRKLLNAQVSVKFLLGLLFPNFMKTLAKWRLVEMLPGRTMDFFKTFVEATIEKRISKETYRNDFIQMMIEHEETEKASKVDDAHVDENTGDSVRWKALKKTLTNSEILAQSILFLLAGSETTATTITYVAYLLAKNPDVQARLSEAVEAAYHEHGRVNYEMVNQIEYLDMVLDETMRLFPPVLRVDRKCGADYKYKNMTIPKGTIWTASIWALHHDANIYPDPEKFDPERFSVENKKKRDGSSFIPFGGGPRACLGLRFAQLEIKLFVCKFLLKYEFQACEQTPEKIEIDNSGLAKSKAPIIIKLAEKQ